MTEQNQISNDLIELCHDLKAPVACIQTLTESLQLSDLPEAQQKALAAIESACSVAIHQFDNVIDNHQDHVRADANEQFSVKQYLSSIVELLKYQTNKQLIVNVDPSIPSELLGNSLIFNRICFNLIYNAIKYSNKDIIHIHLINLSEYPDKIIVEFKVQNNFNQEENISSGTHLGLKITKKLVGSLNGWYSFNKTNETATAICRLPFQKISNKVNKHVITKKTTTLLLVEDDTIAANAITKLLEDYHIWHVHTWEEATLKLKEIQPQLMVIDLHLRDIPLLQLVDRIINFQGLPIIALTAMIDNRIQQVLTKNQIPYLTKPVNKRRLDALIEKTIQTNSVEPIVIQFHLPAIDWEVSLQKAKNNATLRNELLKSFMENLSRSIPVIEQAYIERDYTLLYDELHSLYGASGFIAMPRFNSIAKKYLSALEQEASDKEIETLHEGFALVIDALQNAYLENVNLISEVTN